LKILKNLLSDYFENFVVESGAGMGKLILAIFLFKLLNTDNEDFILKNLGKTNLLMRLDASIPRRDMILIMRE